MRPRTLAAGALASCAAILLWWSCSSSAPERVSENGDAGTAASGGTGGVGGAASGGLTAAGGRGGAGPVDWGADPKWELTTAVAAGCPVQRLVNASELRILAWQPCAWSSANCEEAVFNPKLVGSDPGYTPASEVHDDGSEVRIGLNFGFQAVAALIARRDGWGVDGIRNHFEPAECHLWGINLFGERFGVMVAPFDDSPFGNGPKGGVLGRIGATIDSPVGFTIPVPTAGYGPGERRMGQARWAWRWGDSGRLTSVSSTDGSGFAEFATSSPRGPFLMIPFVVNTGRRFLFDVYELHDGGAVQSTIQSSDGIAPAEPYLVPASPDEHYGFPAYANSHVAFIKGINMRDINLFDRTELWASPFSDNPDELAPVKVADLPYQSMALIAGGWGRVVTPNGPAEGAASSSLLVRDLAQGSEYSVALPKEREFKKFLGLSREHLWLAVSKPASGKVEYLVRFAHP
jgi:hypothetical protein